MNYIIVNNKTGKTLTLTVDGKHKRVYRDSDPHHYANTLQWVRDIVSWENKQQAVLGTGVTYNVMEVSKR